MAIDSWTPNETMQQLVDEAKARAASMPPRELLIKLVQMITDRIGVKVTVEDPEYWGLFGVVTDEMAEVALCMKRRKPMTFAQLQRATGKSADELESLLAEMSRVGLIEYNWENPSHEKQWVLPPFVPGSAEFTNMNVEFMHEHPEVAVFFEHMSRLPLEKITPMVPPGGAGIGMHVIPVEAAINAESKSVSIEHISHWLKKYEGKYAAGLCSCRESRAIQGQGTGDDAIGWCIGVGDMADYLIETGKTARYLTYDEVMETLQRAEDNGFVHQITNIDGEDKIFAICNCNIDTCYALRTSQLFNTPNMSRSAYVAHVDADACVACGRCVENCPAGALRLGQKLPTVDGAIEYPKQELPDAVKWGPEKWDVDYRDTIRNANCHEAGTSPCKTACPAHIAVQGYLKLAAQGKYTEALALIKRENPFPAVCGHVCNRRCEDECTRCGIDAAVAIDDVKRFIAERDLDAATRYVPPIVPPSNTGGFDEKVAIIGAGPAGLSCAFYLAEKGYQPVVFERNERPGGMLTYGIPSFRLDPELVVAEIQVMRDMGVEIRCGVEVGRDTTIQQLRDEGFKAFYVAIGCQGGAAAGVPGEDAAGVASAVEFLRKVAENGEAAVAELLGGKVDARVVVIGGGNVAVDAARTAARCGAGQVDMVCLEARDAMPADSAEVSEAEAEGVQLNCGWGIAEIQAEGGKATGVVLKRCTSVLDSEGKFAPVYDEADTRTVAADAVVLAIGQTAQWGSLLEGEGVQLNANGTAQADAVTYQTAQPDVFVGGDVFSGPKFAIDAIAAGKQAAISLHRFVRPGADLMLARDKREFAALDKATAVIEGYDNASRQVPAAPTGDGAHRGLRDCTQTLTEEQVRIETARCLGCGVSVVDENRCIGCGICTTKCGFDAIHLHRDRPECSRMVASEDKMKAIFPYLIKREIKIKLNRKK